MAIKISQNSVADGATPDVPAMISFRGGEAGNRRQGAKRLCIAHLMHSAQTSVIQWVALESSQASCFLLHRFEREWDLGSVGHNDHVYIYILGNIGYLFEVNSHITYAPIYLTSSTSE